MITFDILSYGTPDNITDGIKNALKDIKNCGEEATLVFPKNTYHFFKENSSVRVFHPSNTDSKKFPEKHIAFLLEDIEDLTVDGCGSEFIVHGDMMFLAAVRCKNITFRNFSWDYPTPAIAEMKTIAVNEKYADFRMPETQQWRIKGLDIEWYETSPLTGETYWKRRNASGAWGVNLLDLEAKTLIRSSRTNTPFTNRISVKKLDEHTVRIKYLGKKAPAVKKNTVFVLCPNRNRKTSGAFFWESSNIVVEDIQPLYLHGFSWLVQMCRDITFRRCRFMPKKNADRYITSFADSLHAAGCAGYLHVEDCDFSHDLDDPINIHGSFMRVKEMQDKHTLSLIYCHDQQGGFRQFFEGDKVAFFARDTLLGAENEKLYTVESATDAADSKDLMTCTVKFREELPSYLGEKIGKEGKFVAENVTYTCDVVIKGCTFSYVPTRGILCTTRGKVLIENNEFIGMTMATIFISNDSDDWYESGPVRDMTIKDNKFWVFKSATGENENKGGVFINPITKGGKLPSWENPIHKNITIENNEFIMEHDNAVKARSVENLIIKNNTVIKHTSECTDESITAFRFENCKNVVLENNVGGDGVELTPESEGMPAAEIKGQG